MGFKMKGSEFYGKLKLNRNMDNSSKPDGRAKSSAFQKMEDEPTMKVKGPEVTISADKVKREKAADKFARVKSTKGDDAAKLKKVTEEYGGKWKRGKHHSGSTIYVNEKGESVKEAARSQNIARREKEEAYKAEQQKHKQSEIDKDRARRKALNEGKRRPGDKKPGAPLRDVFVTDPTTGETKNLSWEMGQAGAMDAGKRQGQQNTRNKDYNIERGPQSQRFKDIDEMIEPVMSNYEGYEGPPGLLEQMSIARKKFGEDSPEWKEVYNKVRALRDEQDKIAEGNYEGGRVVKPVDFTGQEGRMREAMAKGRKYDIRGDMIPVSEAEAGKEPMGHAERYYKGTKKEQQLRKKARRDAAAE